MAKPNYSFAKHQKEIAKKKKKEEKRLKKVKLAEGEPQAGQPITGGEDETKEVSDKLE